MADSSAPHGVRVGPPSFVPIPYTKPYLTVADQLELLRARGMSITDAARAMACLNRIGYYRLSGYAYPFRHREIVPTLAGHTAERVGESFRPETSFSGIMELYVFDKRLRLLFLDAIEWVEIAVRVEVALLLGTRGPFAHRDAGTFNPHFQERNEDGDETAHERFLRKLDHAALFSKEDFAEHYRKKYESPLPLWMAIELWDFGTLSTVLNGMQDPDRAKLAAVYGLPRNNFLPSWAQSINFVRNICAHHGRLWNRPMVQQPQPPRRGEIASLEHLVGDQHAQRRLYAVAVALLFLLREINPTSSWAERMRDHLATFPKLPGLTLRHLGFPDGWQEQEIWNAPVTGRSDYP